jgi:NADH dehydrogenase FAD-containing subunit
MGKQLILIGGGHAHMVTLANLDKFIKRGHRVTVIGPSAYHYYSGMGPGLLSRIYSAPETRFAIQKIVEARGGRFVRDTVTHIDPDTCRVFTHSGAQYAYDVLSCNTGSYVPSTATEYDQEVIFYAKPIERLLQARSTLMEMAAHKHVVVSVVGGGAAAVEIAGNTWRLLSRHSRRGFRLRLFSSGPLLSRFPKKVRQAGLKSLASRDIEVLQHCPVRRVTQQSVETGSGGTYPSDMTFFATGVLPSPIFRASGMPIGPDGGLAVNQFLQCTGYANIFGGGDCIYYQDRPLEKVGVYAVRQNPILFGNLMACLNGENLTPFSPEGTYLLIFNMGDGTGIFYKSGILLQGRLAFIIKDYIDRRFMRKYQ